MNKKILFIVSCLFAQVFFSLVGGRRSAISRDYDLSDIQQQLENGKSLKKEDQRCLLNYSVQNNDRLPYLDFFLKSGVDCNLARDDQGNDLSGDYPLLVAAQNCNVGAFELLLKYQSDLLVKSRREETVLMMLLPEKKRLAVLSLPGRTGLDVVCLIKTFMEHPDAMKLINSRDCSYWSALTKCCVLLRFSDDKSFEEKQTIKAIIDLLLKCGENPHLEMGKSGPSLVDWIIGDGRRELANHLVQKYKEFKSGCSSRLSLFLMDGGKRSGRKDYETLSYGPFSSDIANEIAAYRFHFDGDIFDFKEQQYRWLKEKV